MTVDITDNELNIFSKNGISKEDIRNTVNIYRNQGVSDEEIRAKFDAKLKTFQGKTEGEALPENNTQNKTLYGGVKYDYQAILEDNSLNREQKVDAIKTLGAQELKDIDRQKNWEIAKYIGGAGLEIGSAVFPMGGLGRLGAQAGLKMLKPVLGKKIAQEAGAGAAAGLGGGAVFGLGRGMLENDNPLKTAGIDAALGLALGAPLGLAGAKIGQKIAANRLKNIRNIKELRKAETDFYKDYIQQTAVKRNDLGKINFTQTGLETVSKQPEAGRKFATLKKDIKNAQYIGEELPYHPRNDGIVKFHRLENNGQEFLIGETADGRKYYMSEIKNGSDGRPSRVVSEPPDTIITDNVQNVKPAAAEIKNAGLVQNADLPPEIEAAVRQNPPEYQVLHNKDLMLEAQKEIENADDISSLASRLRQKKEYNALDFEKVRQIISKLYQENKIDEALELTEIAAQKGSKAGQAVQAMSLWQKTTPEGAVKQAQKIIDEYNKTARKKIPNLTENQAKTIISMAENIQKSADGRVKDVATGQLLKYFADLVPQSFGNKIKTIRNISLLLNPTTISRNIAGNAIFAGMENLAAKPLAAGIDALASLFTGQRTRALPNMKAYGKGLIQGLKEGAEDVKLGIDTRGMGGRFDLPQTRVFKNPVMKGLEETLDYSLRVPDRMFYQAAFEESLANQMRAAGVDKVTDKMLKNASEEALEAVYQNNGVLSNAVLGTRKTLNNFGIKDFGAGDVLIPYAQTPANLVQQGINYSPLGGLKSIYNALQGNQRQATLDAARALAGSGLMTGSGIAAKEGIINPAVENYRARKNYEALGIRPNTINLPGGYNMSVSQLEPLSTSVLSGAELGQGGDFTDAANRSLGALFDLSMLQGLNQFAENANDDGLATALYKLAASVPSQFSLSGLNTVNKFADPYSRETYDPNPLKQGYNQAINKIPGLSKKLPLKYDVTGQPVKKYNTDVTTPAGIADRLINPVFINKEKDDETLKELISLYERTGDQSALLPVADKKIMYTDLRGNDVEHKLTGEEYSTYQQQLGAVNKQIFDNIVNSGLYNMIDDEGKLNLISKIQRSVKSKVDEALFNKPNAQKRQLIKQLTQDEKQKIIDEVLNKYSKEILPLQVEKTYQELFGN